MKISVTYFLLLLHFSLSHSASATSILPISLEQLSQKATNIIYAEAIDNTVAIDPASKQIVTYTTFNILQTIKGKAAASYKIKQLGGELKDSNTRLTVHGVPRFIAGEKYIVFLPEKSSLGFSSPLGLHQGSYSVTEVDGEQVVSNGRNLTALTQQTHAPVMAPLAVSANNPAQARLQDFINTVRVFNVR